MHLEDRINVAPAFFTFSSTDVCLPYPILTPSRSHPTAWMAVLDLAPYAVVAACMAQVLYLDASPHSGCGTVTENGSEDKVVTRLCWILTTSLYVVAAASISPAPVLSSSSTPYPLGLYFEAAEQSPYDTLSPKLQ